MLGGGGYLLTYFWGWYFFERGWDIFRGVEKFSGGRVENFFFGGGVHFFGRGDIFSGGVGNFLVGRLDIFSGGVRNYLRGRADIFSGGVEIFSEGLRLYPGGVEIFSGRGGGVNTKYWGGWEMFKVCVKFLGGVKKYFGRLRII